MSTCFHSNVWAWVSQGWVAIQTREIGWICIHLLQHLENLSPDSQPSWKDLLQPPLWDKKSSFIGPSLTHLPALISECRGEIIWHLSPPFSTSQALHVPQDELIIGLQMTPDSENQAMALGIWNPFNLFAEQALLVFSYATQAPGMWYLNSSPAMMYSRVPAPICYTGFLVSKARSPRNLQGIADGVLVVFLFC